GFPPEWWRSPVWTRPAPAGRRPAPPAAPGPAGVPRSLRGTPNRHRFPAAIGGPPAYLPGQVDTPGPPAEREEGRTRWRRGAGKGARCPPAAGLRPPLRPGPARGSLR